MGVEMAATCVNCGSEISGAAKFCAVCGTPVPRPEPPPVTVTPAASTGYAPPSHVNPFAATASPSHNPIGNVVLPEVRGSAPPPPADPPPRSANVSPLAVSNALAERGSFEAVLAKEGKKAPTPNPGGPVKKPGTQLMTNAPKRPDMAPKAEPPAEPKKPVARTVAMGFNPAAGAPWAKPSGSIPAPADTEPKPQSAVAPSGGAAPQSVLAGHPQSTAAPSGYAGQPSHPAGFPSGPGGWSWPQPAPAATPPAYGQSYPTPFGYAPGARVHVTWSNGQRYPATVSQVNGAQCLVVFPDGQQHWVEMQYLAPG